MSLNKALFSSDSDEWSTPQDLFIQLDKEFCFTLDPCATKENTKCKKFYTKEDNGLIQDWKEEFAFVNPPYSNIKDWVSKASKYRCVMLIPARTDTKWFHEYIYQKPDVEIRFLKGRLKFSNSKNSAPFPSMIVIFRKGNI